MTRFRIVPLALGVVALLAVVALAARGAPMRSGAGAGSGPSAAFYDYSWTSLVILYVLSVAGLVGALWMLRGPRGELRPYWMTIRSLLGFFLLMGLIALLARYHLHFHRFRLPGSGSDSGLARGGKSGASRGPASGASQSIQFQWAELLAVLGFLLVLGSVLWFRRPRGPMRQGLGRSAPETLAAALDESLDDLRADPDLRRAIIAAYARMERALAAAGLPRRPSEAPLEYLERALLSLEASAGAVRRLTDLFEWARFSHHVPEPSMRDEAVDALVAVRDELRNSAAVAA